MKKLLLLLTSLIFLNSYAQLDREHWFAPMIDRVESGSGYQTLYLSTNETTPFRVDVYSNGTVIGSSVISKNNPGIFPVQRDYIITTNQYDLFRPVSKGLYLKGEKPFYASLRFSIKNHAEILTSKGTAAVGTEFRAVMAPNRKLDNDGNTNFMTSVLATEDNTTVTVSNFRSPITFSVTPPNLSNNSFSFTLNKGQSYIIDGISYAYQNTDSFIGAKITATKPITITNGNFNGQYVETSANSTDILMDQGVPVDRLGQEFVLMKGNSDVSYKMEKAIIVATENFTEIYLNNNSTPVKILNAGQYYETDPNAYISQGSGHYNMRIKTNKNVYVYQLLAGASGSSVIATGGFNYIPPLSCYLPKKIDEIGLIDENFFISNSNANGILHIPTKLNIITERGATVRVERNGSPIVLSPQNGPFDVYGNVNWVTYSIPSVSGNIAIFSSKAVTAGISAGDDAVGYGGYFAGFSFIPAIIKSEGECLPGVKLEVTEGFDSYLWLLKVGNSYVPAPGVNTNNVYVPQQAGIYAVKLKQGSCAEIQTDDFKFYNCTTYTGTTHDICDNITLTPGFTLSTQTVNPASVKIETPPTKGTATPNADGTITYTANPDATGNDSFKYSFCGSDAIPDCETVLATVKLHQIIHYPDTLTECSAGPTAVFDLTQADLTQDPTAVKKYYTDAAYQNEIPAAEVTAYTSAPGFVYVALSNDFGCTAKEKIELKTEQPPAVNPAAYTREHCDSDIDNIIDGIFKVSLDDIKSAVIPDSAGFTVRYYQDEGAAAAGGNNNLTGIYTFTADTSVWLRVDSPGVCGPVFAEIPLKVGMPVPVLLDTVTKEVCDSDNDQSESVNLQDYITEFTDISTVTAQYFATLEDAQNDQNPISPEQTVNGSGSFYLRIAAPGYCTRIAELNFTLAAYTSSDVLPSLVTICAGNTTVLDVGTGFTGILWSTGETDQTITVGPGTYWVDLTNAAGCVYRQDVTVVNEPQPLWNMDAYSGINCDDDFDGNATVQFSSITPLILSNSSLFDVEYSLFSDFSVILPDDWSYSADTTVYVRAKSANCPAEVKTIEFKIGVPLNLDRDSDTVYECDDDQDGIKEIDLSSYTQNFTSETGVSATFFTTKEAAQNNIGSVPAVVTVDGSATYYLRFYRNGFCPTVAELTVNIKIPKVSASLKDVAICPEGTVELDAGTGFDSYLWSTGSTQSTVTVTVGEYWVDLEYNGCVYRHNVSVKAVILPVITGIDIDGTTVTVNVAGGTPPYKYSLDGSDFQPANVFTNVPGGEHTVMVISADDCAPVAETFNVIQIYNVITPNADGINDYLDLSGLLKKDNPDVMIFDRYGKTVFKGDKNNRFIWDGKTAGTTVATGTYWYVIQWQEPGSGTVTKRTGWILVKPRN